MVKYWDEERKRAIRILKFRIAHHEKHGNGDVVMKEKSQLKKLERHIQVIKDKNN